MIAGALTFYGVAVLQDKMVTTEEAKKDPKNPYGEIRQIQFKL